MVAILDSLRKMVGKAKAADKRMPNYKRAIEVTADEKATDGKALEAVYAAVQEMGKTVEELGQDVELFKKRRGWIADIAKAEEAREKHGTPLKEFQDAMTACDEELRDIRLRKEAGKLSESQAVELRKAAHKKLNDANDRRIIQEAQLTQMVLAGGTATDFLMCHAHESFHEREQMLLDELHALDIRNIEEMLERQRGELSVRNHYHPDEPSPQMEEKIKMLEKRLGDASRERDRINAERDANRLAMLDLFAFLG